jgi:broad specificity phosphatase PhoE
MGRWFIVRHGETEWNVAGRVQGHTDIGLSERGCEQARTVARRLAQAPIDVAYTSDLCRASETARIILAARDVPLCPTPRLREYRKGVFEGLTPEETSVRHPELYAASLINDLDFAPPGGESTRQSSARMAALVADLRALHPEEMVLIVGHGGSLRSLVVALLSLPLEANWRFVTANCGLSIIDTYSDPEGVGAVLRLYNDTSHLDGLERAISDQQSGGRKTLKADG